MLSRPSALAGLIRQSAALRSTSRYPAVIGPVLGIPGSSCLSSTPSGLSLLNYPELPPSTSAGSLLRALPSSFRTSTGHRVGGGNPWHSKTQQPTSRWGGISAISPFALATALLVVRLLGWSVGLTPSPESFTSGLSTVRVAPVGCRITTAPHWDLRRRDLHPQVQQLASLHLPRTPTPGPPPPFTATICQTNPDHPGEPLTYRLLQVQRSLSKGRQTSAATCPPKRDTSTMPLVVRG